MDGPARPFVLHGIALEGVAADRFEPEALECVEGRLAPGFAHRVDVGPDRPRAAPAQAETAALAVERAEGLQFETASGAA